MLKYACDILIEIVLYAILALVGLALLAGLSYAQAPDQRGEVVTIEPSYKGDSATAPIPRDMHVQNEGGSDGAGLCVIASTLANGLYQGVPGLDTPDADSHRGHGSTYWQTAKGRPGGYSPDKLKSLVTQVLPGELYGSYLGTDPAILDELSRKGYPIGATMNTGALYNYRPIHHMISLTHYRTNGWACVVDNNDIGKYHWMPASEFARRWIDGGIGWAWVWSRTPPSAASPATSAVLWLAVAIAAVYVIRRQEPSEAAF